MKKLHPVLVGKTKETVARLNGGPQPSKTDRRKEFLERAGKEYVKLTPQQKKQGSKTGLVSYIEEKKKPVTAAMAPSSKPDFTFSYNQQSNKKEINVGKTARNIVGGKGGGKASASSRQLRKESGYSRAERVKLAASKTGKSEKEIRKISPTKTGKILRDTKKGIKEAFKAGAEVCSAAVTGAGGSVKACAKRQGKANF